MGASAVERHRRREHRDQPRGAGAEGENRGATADERIAEELIDRAGDHRPFAGGERRRFAREHSGGDPGEAANALSDIDAMRARPAFALNVAGFPIDMDGAVIAAIARGGQEKLGRGGGDRGGRSARPASCLAATSWDRRRPS